MNEYITIPERTLAIIAARHPFFLATPVQYMKGNIRELKLKGFTDE